MKFFGSLAALVLVSATGCISPSKDLAALVKELGKDNASAYVRVIGPHGSILFVRANPGTNTAAHVIDPDGKMSVGGK